jgi:hypothetical protein
MQRARQTKLRAQQLMVAMLTMITWLPSTIVHLGTRRKQKETLVQGARQANLLTQQMV